MKERHLVRRKEEGSSARSLPSEKPASLPLMNPKLGFLEDRQNLGPQILTVLNEFIDYKISLRLESM